MLGAWRNLQRIKREQASIAEMPVAQLCAITANIHRDTKKASKPFSAEDFCLWQPPKASEGALSPEVAAVALALRHEGLAPSIVLVAWPQVLAAAQESASVPAVRAYASDDKGVWILAPHWEGKNVRGGLVAVHGCHHGTVRLRDVDRPLSTVDLVIPDRRTGAWLEAGLLLVAA